MTIASWPSSEQPRQKLLDNGAASLSDAELLAIFINNGYQGMTALDLARTLLQEFGSLRAVLDASFTDINKHRGMGSSKFCLLQAALALGQRYLEQHLIRDNVFNNSTHTQQYLMGKLRHRQQEVFACLFLDNQHRLICYEELAQGTLDHANVYPREVIKRVLKHNAAALILSHNHPSGSTKPSQADHNVTKLLSNALEFFNVRILDHIIIGEGQLFSFAEQGLLI